MKPQKLMVLLASAALGLGLAGCAGNADASAPTYKVPTISDMDREKQILNAERDKKIAHDYAERVNVEAEAKAKAEAEAKAKAEAEAKAKAEAEAAAKAKAQAPAPAPAKAQPKARNYQPKARSYQPKAQPKRHYQAPRRSGGNASRGGGNEWKVGESKDYGGARWTRTSENEVHSSMCGDTEGNTWPC